MIYHISRNIHHELTVILTYFKFNSSNKSRADCKKCSAKNIKRRNFSSEASSCKQVVLRVSTSTCFLHSLLAFPCPLNSFLVFKLAHTAPCTKSAVLAVILCFLARINFHKCTSSNKTVMISLSLDLASSLLWMFCHF